MPVLRISDETREASKTKFKKVAMAKPIFNNNNAVALTTASNFCAIAVQTPATANQSTGQNSAEMIDVASYIIVGGTTGVGTVVTFQALGADGTWRSLASPVAITIANSTLVNGVINGPFHGLRLNVSGLVGNGVGYAELAGSVRAM